jgi:hypothetical protein
VLVPVFVLQLSGKEVSRCVSRLEALESKLSSHALWGDTQLLPRLVALQHKESLAAAARAAKKELKAAQVSRTLALFWFGFQHACHCCGVAVLFHSSGALLQSSFGAPGHALLSKCAVEPLV